MAGGARARRIRGRRASAPPAPSLASRTIRTAGGRSRSGAGDRVSCPTPRRSRRGCWGGYRPRDAGIARRARLSGAIVVLGRLGARVHGPDAIPSEVAFVERCKQGPGGPAMTIPTPDGYPRVMPHRVIDDADAAIDFYASVQGRSAPDAVMLADSP